MGSCRIGLKCFWKFAFIFDWSYRKAIMVIHFCRCSNVSYNIHEIKLTIVLISCVVTFPCKSNEELRHTRWLFSLHYVTIVTLASLAARNRHDYQIHSNILSPLLFLNNSLILWMPLKQIERLQKLIAGFCLLRSKIKAKFMNIFAPDEATLHSIISCLLFSLENSTTL